MKLYSDKELLVSLTKQDKVDVEEIVTRVIVGVIAKDVTPRFAQLEKKLSDKMDSDHSINVKHHLETRTVIGDLKKDQTKFRESLHTATS